MVTYGIFTGTIKGLNVLLVYVTFWLSEHEKKKYIYMCVFSFIFHCIFYALPNF